ncbi:class I tRNA ligase family protein [Verrucomicrobiota bacterium]
MSTWFVKVEEIKARILEANAGVHWVPEHLRDGRFGKWLQGARDWAVSRNRYWGAPLPVWRSEDGQEKICIGSIAELERLSGIRVGDLHKHFVDAVEIPSQEGRGVLRRVPEVLDCWFESGSMPYAQAHYPFENKEHFERHFPADFIAEGLDQTRGWFYTLMVLSVALFDKPAFRNVVVNGLVLAEDGKKMSKRLKNYPDPAYMIDSYGADALRLYMINSPVVRAEDLCFSEDGVRHLMRHILIPLWNAYSFFVTYANIDRWSPGKPAGPEGSPNILDRWIRSALEGLAADVVAAMDGYDLQRSVRPFVNFIDSLTNWYIRRSRRRFWKSTDDEDKAHAYSTLYDVLLGLSRIAAPFIPLISESIYRNLRSGDMPESVHLCDYPVADGTHRDTGLEEVMTEIMAVVRLGRTLRTQQSLKVRQPLSAIHVVSRNTDILARISSHESIVLDELNVKRLDVGTDERSLAVLRAKPDFRRVGPRFGPKTKEVAVAVGELAAEALEDLAAGRSVTLTAGELGEVELGPEDVVIERVPRRDLIVASESDLIVAIETELTDELVSEGIAREFVNRVQNMRKSACLEVTQRIQVMFSAAEDVRHAIAAHAEYVNRETLCVRCTAVEDKPADAADWDLNGRPCAIRMEPA